MEDLPAEERSRIMRSIKSKNTKPEMVVRRALHQMGFRYRIHLETLPGKPDIVFTKKKKAIFVHGCFWHGHNCHRGARIPKSNQSYWHSKIERNIQRDQLNIQSLCLQGWGILIIMRFSH